MTTIEQEEKRFGELAYEFSERYNYKIPYLRIEQIHDGEGYNAYALLKYNRKDQPIIILKTDNDQGFLSSSFEALKKLNDLFENSLNRLNGKVE